MLIFEFWGPEKLKETVLKKKKYKHRRDSRISEHFPWIDSTHFFMNVLGMKRVIARVV